MSVLLQEMAISTVALRSSAVCVSCQVFGYIVRYLGISSDVWVSCQIFGYIVRYLGISTGIWVYQVFGHIVRYQGILSDVCVSCQVFGYTVRYLGGREEPHCVYICGHCVVIPNGYTPWLDSGSLAGSVPTVWNLSWNGSGQELFN